VHAKIVSGLVVHSVPGYVAVVTFVCCSVALVWCVGLQWAISCIV